MAEDSLPTQSESGGLGHYLSPLNVWGLSVGCAIGWGAFVMPATTLLPKAGPVGVVVGMIIAALIMIVVAICFHYLLTRYPDSGGAYVFTKKVLGFDHAFLCGWSLLLAYLAIMWANATAFILISRYLFGGVFQFGFHYTVAGYDVYLGEVLVTLATLLLFGVISCTKKRVIISLNTVLALVLFFGVVACFFIVVGLSDANFASFEPSFAPGTNPVVGVFGIVALAPWAFLGFEAISHGAGELNFSGRRLLPIMIAAVASSAIIYILMTMVTVVGMPQGYDSWAAYIANLGNLDGLAALPTFNAMKLVLGDIGIVLLALVVVAALSTTLLGLYRATSRLLFAISQDEILPPWFSKLSSDGIPRNAIIFIMAISVLVPFVGRAAIGWVVDVTSVSAAIVYGYAAICSFKLARQKDNRLIAGIAVAGMVSAAVFLVYPLVPNMWSTSALAPESYLIIVVWSIFGLLFFRLAFQRDTKNRFGKSTVVWVLMIFLILFASTMWMRQVTHDDMEEMVVDVSEYYANDYKTHDIKVTSEDLAREDAYLETETADMRTMLLNSSLVQMVLILFSLVIMINIYALQRKREKDLEIKRLSAEETSKAKTAFLSNMSHDIRTPMNAIMGYTHLARRDDATPEEMREYLDKIDDSGKHLMSLINDILDMSHIESGKMQLQLNETDIVKVIEATYDMFATQMQAKNIVFTVEVHDVSDNVVMCDAARLDRVLLNLVSNAYKFTPAGGAVTVVLRQISDEEAKAEGKASFVLSVKDTGIGMTPEFAERVFDAFERERSSTVSGIQGTGLGMAITKSIVDMMEGSIQVNTAPGEGTEFIINFACDIAGLQGEGQKEIEPKVEPRDFSGLRVLLAEDNEINREIAGLILEDLGFEVEMAEDGMVAVQKVASSKPGT